MIPPTKQKFIENIRRIAYHKKHLEWIKSGKKKKITLEDIPDVTLGELNRIK